MSCHFQRTLFCAALILGGVAGRVEAGNITLAWNANTESDLAGYEILYGTESHIYTSSIDAGNRTTWQVTDLTAGQIYYFAVRAYNTSGERSSLSSEVSADLPGADCSFSLSPTSAAFDAAGGVANVEVTTTSECSWRAVSTAPWITVTSAAAGTGTGMFSFEVAPNEGERRVGSLAVAGQTFTVAQAPRILPTEALILGLGPSRADGGRFQVRGSALSGFAPVTSVRVPLDAYNAANGATFPAVGDVDGDGLDEVVVGLGVGGGGWIFVFDDGAHDYKLLASFQLPLPAYNEANGTVYPAVGDLDGDGRAEIVAGLGEGGAGRYAIFDDAQNNYRLMRWLQVPWKAYRLSSGETHPAVGDVDGDGLSEIVVGLGRSGQGWIEIRGGAPSFSPKARIRVPWPSYNSDPQKGHTFPAVGDIDGDGKAEIVVGLGPGGKGRLAVFDDASTYYAMTGWIHVQPDSGAGDVGETRPAVGNLDADPAAELVIGLADLPGRGGRFQVRDDAANGHAILGSTWTDWAESQEPAGATTPAVGKLR